MKFSKYGSLLPLSENTSLIYSATADQFIVFKKELEPLLVDCTPEDLQEKASDLYEKMRAGNIIVESDKDELEDVKRRSHEVIYADNTYQLFINPTMNCNFRCWYCYEDHIAGSKISIPLIEGIEKYVDTILRNNSNLETFHLSFFGGEPLLYYKDTVQIIIDKIRIKCKQYGVRLSIFFTSNGFLINDKVIAHLKAEDEPVSFQITLDGHREQHNKVRFSTSGAGSYDRIVNNVKKLLQEKISVNLRINYTIDNIESVPAILEDIKTISEQDRLYLRIGFHKVWQDNEVENDKETEVDKSIDIFKEEFPSIHIHDKYSLDGIINPCYADKENQLLVNYNGDLFKCTARDFTTENRCGILLEDGSVQFEPGIMEKRTACKEIKNICENCRIYPLCGGGCSQKNFEIMGQDLCVMGFGKKEKDNIILNRFFNQYVNPH